VPSPLKPGAGVRFIIGNGVGPLLNGAAFDGVRRLSPIETYFAITAITDGLHRTLAPRFMRIALPLQEPELALPAALRAGLEACATKHRREE
jgi:hypothetical protein